MEEAPGYRIPYDRRWLGRCLLAVTGFSSVIVWTMLAIWGMASFPLKVLAAVALVAILSPLAAITFWAARRLITKEPALEILDGGVIIAFGFEKPYFLPWTEIRGVYERGFYLCFDLSDPAGFLGRRSRLLAWLMWESQKLYGSPVCVSQLIVTATAAELREVFSRHTTVMAEGPAPAVWSLKSERRYWAVKAALAERESNWPKSVAEFQHRFREDLIGIWHSTNLMPSPVDLTIGFHANGTGYVSPFFMTGYEGDFEWRSSGERKMEIRDSAADSPWVPVSWLFESREMEDLQHKLTLSVVLSISGRANESGNSEQWYVSDALCAMEGSVFHYAGEPHNQDESDDAN